MSAGAVFIIQKQEDLMRPSVVNRAFVPLALAAGIETTLVSLVGLGLPDVVLLERLKVALATDNPPLAAALSVDTLNLLLDYLKVKSVPAPVLRAADAPKQLDQAGPASTSGARDGGTTTQVNITFSAPPAGFHYEIYLDGVFAKTGTLVTGEWTFEALFGVAAGAHTIRVLYVRDSDGAMTRFGDVVTIT